MRSLRVLLPALVDAAVLALAMTAAFHLWAAPVRDQSPDLYLSLLPGVVLFNAGYAQAGLYPGFGLGGVETLRRYWLVTTAGFVALAAVTWALKVPHLFSRMTVGLAFLLSLAMLPVARVVATGLFRRFGWWAEPVVLAGTPEGVARVRDALEERPGLGFRPVGVLGVEEIDGGAGSVLDARIALVDAESTTEEALARLRHRFPRVLALHGYADLPVEGVQVRNLGGLLGLEYGNNLLRPHARFVKRAVDLVLGSLLLILSLPVILLAALAIRLSGPGSVLFRQAREGRHGREIQVPKLRTMLPDADRRLEEVFEQDSALRDEWQEKYKLADDPRLIRGLGRFLRRFSIDELPQLWSVVKGDMSLVGPRPFPHYHLAALSESSLDLRRRVRPGLTGLWQVVARGVADVRAQEDYDTYYIRNWSLWLDLYILGRTVAAVASGRGAY